MAYALAGADFDRDGAADLVVGAPWASIGNVEAGAAYVLLGPLAPA